MLFFYSVALEDYKKIKENLYKLPRMRYEDLAKELRIEESVIVKKVDKFLILEKEHKSDEVKQVFNTQTQLKVKTQEETKETKDLRELVDMNILENTLII